MNRFFSVLAKDVEGSQLVSNLLQVIAAFYSILLGFIIYANWQDLETARDNVDDEASAFASILQDSAVLPEEIRQEIKTVIGKYVVIIRTQEWEKLRTAEISPHAEDAIDDLYTVIQSFEPQTNREQIFYAEIVQNLTSAFNGRRARLAMAHNTFPIALSIMLIVGSLILTILTASLGGLKNKAYHALVNGALGGLLAFCLILVVQLTHPFTGTVLINAAPFSEGTLGEFK